MKNREKNVFFGGFLEVLGFEDLVPSRFQALFDSTLEGHEPAELRAPLPHGLRLSGACLRLTAFWQRFTCATALKGLRGPQMVAKRSRWRPFSMAFPSSEAVLDATWPWLAGARCFLWPSRRSCSSWRPPSLQVWTSRACKNRPKTVENGHETVDFGRFRWRFLG